MRIISEESGLGLIEIVVAIVILAIVMLGMGSLHLSTIQMNKTRNDRRVAITLAQEKIEDFYSQIFTQLQSLVGTSETVTDSSELNNYNGYQRISSWNYVNEDNFDVVSGSATEAIRITVTVSSTASSLINQFFPITQQATRTSWE